jgi:hypothetical protein
MKNIKLITSIIVLMVIPMATAAVNPLTAYYTGKSQTFTTVTGKAAIRCEYRLGGYPPFWRSFSGFVCPNSVEVE